MGRARLDRHALPHMRDRAEKWTQTWPGGIHGATVSIMSRTSDSSCCVCNASDARSLVDVVLRGGGRATLCGSHALMHRRSSMEARTPADLRVMLSERRKRAERRTEGDALGESLSTAFAGERRGTGSAARRRG
jgi:hypothetical protein